jgi:oligoribonuclease NrnB/cAMP/cGMP phosphodiesterase (DHH superfamily)
VVQRVCVFHAGCPDGFGAAWAVWRAWGDDARYVPRGHDDPLHPEDFEGAQLVFVDIAPPPATLPGLGELCSELVVLDHHVSARERILADTELLRRLELQGHRIHFDLDHSGAILAWQHFHPDAEPPGLLRYVEDQDLWNWKLPSTREVNAAISAAPHAFDAWETLSRRDVEDLAREGAPVVHAQRIEVERALGYAHSLHLAEHHIEAVNARVHRSLIGHELASRAAFGVPCGVVYRMSGRRVDVSVYSVGEFDVAAIAEHYGGGGHHSAAGFSVPVEDWISSFL